MINSRLREFCEDRSGAAIILAALMMPVLVGGMGLGAETGYRYFNQRVLQHAADFAAHAGAVRKYKGDAKPAIDAAALHVATESDFAASIGTIAVNIPPASGAFTGDPSAVEVILTETRPRLFSAIFSEVPVDIGARAVAAVTAQGSSGCILSLSETASPGVTVQGSPSVTLTACSVAANSSAADAFSIPNSLNTPMSVECVYTVGGAYTHSDGVLQTECTSVMENAPATQDPYYWVAEPAFTGTCHNKMVGKPNQTTTVTPTETWTHPSGVSIPVRRYCNGLDAKGIVNFEPGLYIVEGGTMTSSGTNAAQLNSVAGTTTYNNGAPGVTFYFTNGGAVFVGG